MTPAELLAALPEPVAERVRAPGEGRLQGAYVVYWCRVAARDHDNPALDAALHAGRLLGLPVFVYQAVSERYPYASDRLHRFLLEGARDLAVGLAKRGVGYALHVERPGHRGAHLHALGADAALVVTDWMPVPPLSSWTARLARAVAGVTPVWEVDASCVVPMSLSRRAHDRAFAFRDAHAEARELRVSRPWADASPAGPAFLPALPFAPVDPVRADLDALVAAADIDHTVGPVLDMPGGMRAADARWRAFLRDGLGGYARRRNDAADPGGVSRMSAYLHFGHVSPLRVAREVAARRGNGAEKWLDELLIWRELAWHWCAHHPDPNKVDVLPRWALATLRRHAADPRPALLSWETLARARTGEPLWDAAQRSLLVHGELHNNVRMTWGKALLAWTDGPESALAALVDLNHRYALDGRDPSSYGGLLWCLGGFDRPFKPATPILGEVRPRDVAAHASRLDLEAYEAHVARPRAAFRPRTIVVGAGVAGALLARTLADHGEPVIAFDKGRGPGGRLSTRRGDGGSWDHGAPAFVADDPHLARHVASWAQDGVVERFAGPFLSATRGADGWTLSPREVRGAAWVGVPGMNAVVRHLLDAVDARFCVEVAGLRRVGAGPGAAWEVTDAAGEVVGVAERVAVCAPAPQAAALLRSAEGATAGALVAALDAVRMAPEWVVLASFAPAVPVDAGHVRVEGGALAALTRSRRGGGADRWVLRATPAWSAQHLEATREEVAAALVAEACAVLGAAPPISAVAHRWRFSRVEAPVGQPCGWSPEDGLGAAGDAWLGDKVVHAWRSGAALAGRLLAR